ncbi:MAG: ATP-dependent sacrificial sulfur transferase LarE [Nitrososphaerales archaeon]
MKLLIEWFDEFESCAIAFSGGVDSSVLAFAAKRALGDNAIAILSVSPAVPISEIANAIAISEEIGIKLFQVSQDDLANADYTANNVNRCYFCRTNLGNAVDTLVEKFGIKVRVDGTHIDDMKSPRPGVKALRKAGFRAPFVELDFTKLDIRAVAHLAGLSNAGRPSEACLSSRIAFGQRIDQQTLSIIEEAERLVKVLTGAKIVRVRTVGRSAMVEVDSDSIERARTAFAEIESGLKTLGYLKVEISKEGYVSGKMLDLFIENEIS